MSNPTLVHGKRQSLGETIWEHRASYLLMAPYFILFFFFTVLPVLMAIGVSVHGLEHAGEAGVRRLAELRPAPAG
jgi:ABC-type sugar transport systems, permease components